MSEEADPTAAIDDEADDDEADWVEVRRFSDPIGATMIRDFLQDHEVRVAIRGNPLATRMTWSQTTDNLRIVVAKADLDKAKEALAAMSAGDAHPFRGPIPPPVEEEEEVETKFEKPRSGVGGAMLALFVPIGAGHFYARHGAAGTILGAGMVGSGLAGILARQPALFRAWGILILVDMVGAFFAVRRFNAHRVPSEPQQRFWAAVAVAAAFAIAWLSAAPS